jgi:hypothetical protein
MMMSLTSIKDNKDIIDCGCWDDGTNTHLCSKHVLVANPDFYMGILQVLWDNGIHANLTDIVDAHNAVAQRSPSTKNHYAIKWLVENDKTLPYSAASIHLRWIVSTFFGAHVSGESAYIYFTKTKKNLAFFINVLEDLVEDGKWICPSSLYFAITYGVTFMSIEIDTHTINEDIPIDVAIRWLLANNRVFNIQDTESDLWVARWEVMRLRGLLQHQEVGRVYCECEYLFLPYHIT